MKYILSILFSAVLALPVYAESNCRTLPLNIAAGFIRDVFAGSLIKVQTGTIQFAGEYNSCKYLYVENEIEVVTIANAVCDLSKNFTTPDELTIFCIAKK